MLTERLVFRAKYGHGDELAGLFKEWFGKMAAQAGLVGARVYTDATGPMFSVIAESDFNDMAAYASFSSQDQEMYRDPEFQKWFARMQELTEHGERQLFHMERLA
jgi:quinol monooxygenase YgiN